MTNTSIICNVNQIKYLLIRFQEILAYTVHRISFLKIERAQLGLLTVSLKKRQEDVCDQGSW